MITKEQLNFAKQRYAETTCRDTEKQVIGIVESVYIGRGARNNFLRAKFHSECGRVYYVDLDRLEVIG